MKHIFYTLPMALFLGLAQPAQAQLLALNEEVSQPLAFVETPDPVAYEFRFTDSNDDYLVRFREMYGLDEAMGTARTDLERVQALSRWVHNRLNHDGRQDLKTRDAFVILHAVMLGESVQCVEYGAVLTTALNAVGIPARPLFLKEQDADTKSSAGGHALTEAWLPDQGKWIMVDSQFDGVPLLNGQPLNAVELQQALATKAQGLSLAGSSSKSSTRSYFRWLGKYLYYFDTYLDNRVGVKASITKLMLLPAGARKIVAFQRKRFSGMRYTRSVATFYAPPQPMPTTAKAPVPVAGGGQ